MRTRPILATALVAATLAVVPLAAHAADAELVSRSTFDSAPTVSSSTIHVDGATAGPLGGFLDLTARAQDGTLPAVQGDCEVADVTAVLTLSPGEQLAVSTTGEICMHQFSPTLVLQSYFDKQDVTYAGTEHRKAKIVGDGSIAASNGTFLGFGASFSTSVRWG